MSSVAEATLLPFELSRTTPNDRYFDYCLEPYTPRRSPRGKLRAENLLWSSLHEAGLLDKARPPLRALQQSLGRDMTVWGAKFDGNRLFWELYFYDPRKEDPEATVTGIAATLSPWLKLSPPIRESIPYMMMSFDLDDGVLSSGRVDELNLYLAGSTRHEGRSYKFRQGGAPEFENFYRFLEPKREIDEVLSLLTSSAFVDYGARPNTLSQVLIPEYFACRRVCVAKKRLRDGIYFSGIHIDQLLHFLERFSYPDGIRNFARRHADDLDHLFFDIGIDFEQLPDGTIVHTKTSFYGTL